MLEFEQTEWTEATRDQAKEFFTSKPGRAFLTDLFTQYKGRMESLVTMDFKTPNAALQATEIQSEARAFFSILSVIEDLTKGKQDGE